MNFLVLGRAEVAMVTPEMPYIVISVTECEAPEARLAESSYRLGVLRLKFHDIEMPQWDRTLMSSEEASKIIAFVREHQAAARLIISQCEAGMSRSAGVAAALSKWLQEDDRPFFKHYIPNRHVYRLVLEAARESEKHSAVNKENARKIALLRQIGVSDREKDNSP
jgi:predicted protein tyrosine phosphatase